eukprot:3185030-Prymnesium_polylepis.2
MRRKARAGHPGSNGLELRRLRVGIARRVTAAGLLVVVAIAVGGLAHERALRVRLQRDRLLHWRQRLSRLQHVLLAHRPFASKGQSRSAVRRDCRSGEQAATLGNRRPAALHERVPWAMVQTTRRGDDRDQQHEGAARHIAKLEAFRETTQGDVVATAHSITFLRVMPGSVALAHGGCLHRPAKSYKKGAARPTGKARSNTVNSSRRSPLTRAARPCR